MANLNEFKWETHQMCRAKGWDTSSVDGVWLLLSEEFGELASAIRQERGSFRKMGPRRRRGGCEVRSEMADVFSYLFQLAHMLDVDLEQMWREHRIKVAGKKYTIKHIPKPRHYAVDSHGQ